MITDFFSADLNNIIMSEMYIQFALVIGEEEPPLYQNLIKNFRKKSDI